MEKDRTYRTVSVIALIVAVVALSIGYAAFTASLNITAGASVEPENTFTTSIGFDIDSLDFDEDNLPEGLPDEAVDKINAGTITGNNQTWEDIKAVFTKSGQTEVFTASVENGPDFIAYLNEAKFTGEGIEIVEDTSNTAWYEEDNQGHGSDLLTDDLKAALAQCFKVEVKVGNTVILDSSDTNKENYTDTTGAIKIEKDDSKTVTVSITYDTDLAESEVPSIDIPLIVGFKGIEMTWTTYSQYSSTTN